MEDLLNEETIAVILGLVVTLATSLGKNPDWSTEKKTALFVGVSVLAGVLQNLGSISLAAVGESAVVIFTSAQLFYNLWFKKTDANKKLEQTGIGSSS